MPSRSQVLSPRTAVIRMPGGQARTIGLEVRSAVLAFAQASPACTEAWSAALGEFGFLSPGDVTQLPRSPALCEPDVLRQVHDWLIGQGVAVPHSEQWAQPTPLACLGASFHHDADAYAGEVFAVAWLCPDAGWDLLFPATGERIALVYGTTVLFDSALVHGVVRRASDTFDAGDFGFDAPTGFFVSFDLDVTAPGVAAPLGIEVFAGAVSAGEGEGAREVFIAIEGSFGGEGVSPVLKDFGQGWRDSVAPGTGVWTGQNRPMPLPSGALQTTSSDH